MVVVVLAVVVSESSSRHIPPLQVLSVSARCFLCLLPFVIFQDWPAHTCVIVRVYDLSSLVPAYARTHVRMHAGTHTHTEALSVAAVLVTH